MSDSTKSSTSSPPPTYRISDLSSEGRYQQYLDGKSATSAINLYDVLIPVFLYGAVMHTIATLENSAVTATSSNIRATLTGHNLHVSDEALIRTVVSEYVSMQPLLRLLWGLVTIELPDPIPPIYRFDFQRLVAKTDKIEPLANHSAADQPDFSVLRQRRNAFSLQGQGSNTTAPSEVQTKSLHMAEAETGQQFAKSFANDSVSPSTQQFPEPSGISDSLSSMIHDSSPNSLIPTIKNLVAPDNLTGESLCSTISSCGMLFDHSCRSSQILENDLARSNSLAVCRPPFPTTVEDANSGQQKLQVDTASIPSPLSIENDTVRVSELAMTIGQYQGLFPSRVRSSRSSRCINPLSLVIDGEPHVPRVLDLYPEIARQLHERFTTINQEEVAVGRQPSRTISSDIAGSSQQLQLHDSLDTEGVTSLTLTETDNSKNICTQSPRPSGRASSEEDTLSPLQDSVVVPFDSTTTTPTNIVSDPPRLTTSTNESTILKTLSTNSVKTSDIPSASVSASALIANLPPAPKSMPRMNNMQGRPYTLSPNTNEKSHIEWFFTNFQAGPHFHIPYRIPGYAFRCRALPLTRFNLPLNSSDTSCKSLIQSKVQLRRHYMNVHGLSEGQIPDMDSHLPVRVHARSSTMRGKDKWIEILDDDHDDMKRRNGNVDNNSRDNKNNDDDDNNDGNKFPGSMNRKHADEEIDGHDHGHHDEEVMKWQNEILEYEPNVNVSSVRVDANDQTVDLNWGSGSSPGSELQNYSADTQYPSLFDDEMSLLMASRSSGSGSDSKSDSDSDSNADSVQSDSGDM